MNMKKLLLTAAIACSLGVQAQSQMELTATEVARHMAPGWNLGNTMEGGNNANNFTNKGGLGAETSWQDTKTTQAIVDYVKAQGFRSIRIPCAWVMGHLSNATDYTIDAAWMNRVKEIVDYCINADLYVVINQHWDGGWLENNIDKTGDTKTKNLQILEACWQQIAEAFKGYDERLLFAGLNEPNSEDTPKAQTITNLIDYEQKFIDVVRATGGNNEKRILIVQGPSTNIDKTCTYMANKMPKDPTADRLMIEVHYYNPWQFWGMEKDESWGKVFYYWGSGNHVSGSQHNATWGEESEVEKQLESMKKNFQDKGIPVYIGEFGANWRTITGANESQEKHNASIKSHYKCVVQKAMEKGMIPVIWDTNYRGKPSMTIINRKDLSIYNNYMMEGIREALEATAIQTITTQTVSSDDSIYDLQGRRVETAQIPKGIYIQNGKKWISR